MNPSLCQNKGVVNVWMAKMTVTELFPPLKQLSRADKLKVMQFLIAELAKEEDVPTLQDGAVYPVWTPLNSHAAAHKLGELLESAQSGDALKE